MDRNSIIGLVLIFGILIGYYFINKPTEAQIQAKKRLQDSILTAQKQKAIDDSIYQASLAAQIAIQESISGSDSFGSEINDAFKISNDSIIAAQRNNIFGPFAQAALPVEKEWILENDVIKLIITSKGGVIKQAILKEYNEYGGGNLSMYIPELSGYRIALPVNNRVILSDSLYFQSSSSDIKVSGEKSESLSVKLFAGSEDKYLEYKYTLKGNSYLVGFEIAMVGLNEVLDKGSWIDFEWENTTGSQEKSPEAEREKSTIYYADRSLDVSSLSSRKSDKKSIDYPLKWVGFSQQFFTSTLIAKDEFEYPVNIETKVLNDDDLVRYFGATIRIPYNFTASESFEYDWYLGPKNYKILKRMNLGLEEQINLGWKIFRFVNTWLIINVFYWLDKFDISYGLVILILTLIIKLILSPITYKNFVSSAKMKLLKPEIDEINEKNKNADPLKKQQEIMALYRKTGVSPLAGCIPALLQMPILLAMFSFFPSSIELRQQSFLWADDLSSYDSILDLPFHIPFYGDHVSLFTILMTITTLIYTRTSMSQSAMSGPQAQQMKIMMYIMPIIFLGVLNNYSSALSYYYFLANTISIGQTFVIRKFFVNEDKLRAIIEENKKKPLKTKKSKWAQRLEEMQKLQKQRAAEMSRKNQGRRR